MRIDQMLFGQRSKNIAVNDGQKKTTYEELCSEVIFHAGNILKEGFSCANAGVFLPNSKDYICAYFTLAYCGYTVVPVAVWQKEQEIIDIIRHCRIGLVITDTRNMDKLAALQPSSGLCLYTIDDHTFHVQGEGAPVCGGPPPGNDTAVIISTSGSTSSPKRVMLTHGNLYSNTRSIIQSLNLNKKDRTLITLPMMLASGHTSQMLAHIRLGAELFIYPGLFNPKTFLSIIENEGITNTTVVPSQLIVLSEYMGLHIHDLSTLRIICFGGAPTARARILQAGERLGREKLVHMYGQTEASTRLTHLLPSDSKGRESSVGKPIPGVKIKIVREDGSEAEQGESGEIIASGPNIMKGYYNNAAETEKALRDGWLYTGDIGKKDKDGYIYITGRKKNLIISSGRNISPEEVEEVINSIPGVLESRIYGKPDEIYGEIPEAEVVLTDGAAEITAYDILSFCKKRLSLYKVPAKITFTAEIAKTSNNKILRH